LSVMFAPVSLHVEAAHRANSPEQITSGTGELPLVRVRVRVRQLTGGTLLKRIP
jgi:hypothetical protein